MESPRMKQELVIRGSGQQHEAAATCSSCRILLMMFNALFPFAKRFINMWKTPLTDKIVKKCSIEMRAGGWRAGQFTAVAVAVRTGNL